MKKIILLILCILSLIVSVNAQSTYTNGFIYADHPIECRLISSHNGTLTNQLAAGLSYMTGNAILEFIPTNLTTLYLSGNITIIANANSKFTIDIFEQEISNLTDSPRKAKIGNYNLAITIENGIVAISSITNEYSAISLSAQESAFQLSGGQFVFDVNTNSVISYSQGNIKRILTQTKTDDTPKGAQLLINPRFKLTTTESYSPSNIQVEMYNSLIDELNSSSTNVDFFVIQGKLIGIWMK